MKRYTLTISTRDFLTLIAHFLLSITLLCSLFITQASGQAATVEFVVDMQFAQLSPGQVVVLRGSSATLGRWHGGDLQLSPSGGTLYSITALFPERDLGQMHFYKFAVLGPDDDVLWESRPGRTFMLTAGHQTLDAVFFNDIDRPVLSEDLPVMFTLNMDAFSGEPPTAIGIAGNRQPLDVIAPSQLVMMAEEGGLWVVDVVFEAGTPVDLAFRFFLEIDGRWQEEPGDRRHVVMLNNNQPLRTIEMAHNGVRIVPASRVRDLLTDDYEGIISAISAGGKRHLLEAALLQLESGQLSRANNLYNQFESYLALAGEEEKIRLQDTYPVRYGQHLYATGQPAQAASYLSGRESSTSEPARKAAYAYAIAAAQQAAGDLVGAATSFDHVESSYGDELDTSEAAALGRGITYLKSGEYAAGTQKLESLDGTEMRRQAALRAIGHAHADSANYELAEDAFETLTDLGTDSEQVKARLLALEVQLKAGQFDKALAGVEALLAEEDAGDQKEERLRRAAKNYYRSAHLLYLKALILEAQGHDASDLFQAVITNYADTRYAVRAQRRLGN